MSKVKLDLSPAPGTFKHTVTLVLQNGDEADLVIEYIYRTKKEHAAWVDEKLADIKAKSGGSKKKTEIDSVLIAVQNGIATDAKDLLEIAKGWDLQEPFTVENIEAFENKYPGSIQAIATKYPSALFGVRLKN